jgi:hypothetical protein
MGKAVALTVLYSIALGAAIAGVILAVLLIFEPSMRSNSTAPSVVHVEPSESSCDQTCN